jgi:hypothetical protein
MTHKKIIFAILIPALIIIAANPCYAQPEKDADQTLSPYFLVKSHDSDVDRLPLKSTQAHVSISGVIADVTVTQVYKNEGHKPLEAVYVFPASTKAAVYGMKMTIGERTITAKIRKREEARQEYNQAKQAGKSASLLEQHGPNVFQMNVANILPSDVIQVELNYTELLIPTDTVYEFIYPTVVGPRYVDRQDHEAGSYDTCTANPYLHQGEPPTYTFNVLLFAGSSHLMSEHSLLATPQNITHAVNIIDRQRGGGGTRLLPALKRALCLPKTQGFSRSIVIATDGYVSVEEQAFDLIRNNLGRANMFTFGIGSSVNRHLIEGMARVGMGEPFVITKLEQASEKANRFRKLIESPVLTEIKVDFGRFKAFDVEPPSIPDVLADRPVIVFGKWRGRPLGIISIQGLTGETRLFEKGGGFRDNAVTDQIGPALLMGTAPDRPSIRL